MKKMILAAPLALALAANAQALDPLTTRWTLGAHEPYSMYRRMGKKATGGIEGSAKWVKDWLDWWDAKAPETMHELGLNGLHSRFYKGMGWEVEKTDFPNVKKFVMNCHANGVTALAYVQFATLYFESMRAEVPNIDDWAQVDEHGEKRLWNDYYFRWMPCLTCEEWQAYIERILEIALTEGGFDGVMFDNTFAKPCYCARCERKFAEHLASLPHPEDQFGFPSVDGIRQPRPTYRTDHRDPVFQEWVRWRVGVMNGVMSRFRRKIKFVKPDAIVSANGHPFRASDTAANFSLEMLSLGRNLDLFMMQSATFPDYDKRTGVVRNRVRDLKIAQELGKPIVALCDGNAGQYDIDESEYMRPLIEDLIWKGIPTDRTVMSPARTPGFIDRTRLEKRRPKLAELNNLAEKYRAQLSAPSYRPVRILYPATALMFSKAAHGGITAAEEILLRNHVPFGYAIAMDANAPTISDDCDVLVVANQEWLSDAQVDAIADYAKRGGRIVVTGESGLWDEHGAQRFVNPLRESLAGVATVVWRDEPDMVGGELGWGYRVEPPKDGGKALMADLAKTGWQPKVRIEGVPPYVFAEVKKMPDGYSVLFMNYNPSEQVLGAKVLADSRIVDVPAFDLYRFLDVNGCSEVRDSGTTFARDALQKYVDSGELPGAINVFYKDGLQETCCIGYADVDAKRPITLDDVFMQCSQTKGFCGVTVAILVEEGRISLDDPVSMYLPEFKTLWVKTSETNDVSTLAVAKNVLTIRNVMNHTGGFPFELPNYQAMGGWSRRMPLRSVAATAAAQPILFEPGTGVQYSNVGIDIGAAVVEVVTGKRWEEFLRERVLEPLGMSSSGFWPTDKQLARKIEMYDVKGGETAKWRKDNPSMQRPYNDDRVFPSAGAGLWTTARDQLKFYKMLMNLGLGENGVRILKEETVKSILAVSTRPATLKDPNYSLGLHAPLNDSDEEWFGHGGAWGTNCRVNWHSKSLKFWVGQSCGKDRPWLKARNKAAEKFFNRTVDNADADAYTGRMK